MQTIGNIILLIILLFWSYNNDKRAQVLKKWQSNLEVQSQEFIKRSEQIEKTVKASANTNLEFLEVAIKYRSLDYFNDDVRKTVMGNYQMAGNKLDTNWLKYQEKLINSIKHKR